MPTLQTAADPKPLMAFAVTEPDEGIGGVVFASSDIVARRVGANRYNDGELSGMRVRRASWADRFAPGPVPFTALFDQGWWQDCQGCGVRIEDGACDDAGNYRVFKPVETAQGVFCRPSCHSRHQAHERARQRAEQRAIAQLQDHVRSRLGEVVFEERQHAYVSRLGRHWQAEQVVVRFSFPGATLGPASCRFEWKNGKPYGPLQPQFFCPAGDKAAFEAFVAERRSAAR